jgi:hypothetical protein
MDALFPYAKPAKTRPILEIIRRLAMGAMLKNRPLVKFTPRSLAFAKQFD